MVESAIQNARSPAKKMPSTKFSRNILKTIVGEERALNVFASLTHSVLPSITSLINMNSQAPITPVRSAMSQNLEVETNTWFNLEESKYKLDKDSVILEDTKQKESKGLIKTYIAEDDDDSEVSCDSFE